MSSDPKPQTSSLFDRAKAYLRRKSQRVGKKLTEAKTKYYDCPSRKREIAKLFVREMRKVGQDGNAADGFFQLATFDPAFQDPLRTVYQKALESSAKSSIAFAQAWFGGKVPAADTQVVVATHAVLGTFKPFGKAVESVLTTWITSQSFSSLEAICKCANQACSDIYQLECETLRMKGHQDCSD